MDCVCHLIICFDGEKRLDAFLICNFRVIVYYTSIQKVTMTETSPISNENHEFVIPKKGVSSPMDMELWEHSEAYFEYCGFIASLNESVKGKSLSIECTVSETVSNIIESLNTLDLWIDETPAIEQPQRFGNKAFRLWLSKVQAGTMELLQKAVPEKYHRAIPEVEVYFTEAYGNSTRIDYGTGHEMSFIMFLLCLFKIGAFVQADREAVVLRVFNRYLTLVRKLQLTYRMEPAGSHGVWSLDDYQFVPFIWGSSQLVAHPRIEPRAFLQEDTVQMYAKDYMFIGCIKFINQVKTGLFAEHSNQLWNISGVPSWSKINAGLIKMYKKEVLGKFPVIQHVLFGSILQLKVESASRPVRNIRLSLTPPPAPGFVPPPDVASHSTK